MFEENKDSDGNLDEKTMISYNILILNIPESGMSEHHIARKDKLDSKLCDKWSNFKSKMDLECQENLGEAHENKEVCFCCLKDLTCDQIYENWNGNAWHCYHLKKPIELVTLTTEELKKELRNHY